MSDSPKRPRRRPARDARQGDLLATQPPDKRAPGEGAPDEAAPPKATRASGDTRKPRIAPPGSRGQGRRPAIAPPGSRGQGRGRPAIAPPGSRGKGTGKAAGKPVIAPPGSRGKGATGGRTAPGGEGATADQPKRRAKPTIAPPGSRGRGSAGRRPAIAPPGSRGKGNAAAKQDAPRPRKDSAPTDAREVAPPAVQEASAPAEAKSAPPEHWTDARGPSDREDIRTRRQRTAAAAQRSEWQPKTHGARTGTSVVLVGRNHGALAGERVAAWRGLLPHVGRRVTLLDLGSVDTTCAAATEAGANVLGAPGGLATPLRTLERAALAAESEVLLVVDLDAAPDGLGLRLIEAVEQGAALACPAGPAPGLLALSVSAVRANPLSGSHGLLSWVDGAGLVLARLGTSRLPRPEGALVPRLLGWRPPPLWRRVGRQLGRAAVSRLQR